MSTAVLLPGSASTGEFVHRAFSAVLSDASIASWESGSGDAAVTADLLGQWVDSLDHAERLVVIGVSIGAHAAALWASTNRRPHTRLLLALPAWTGPPDDVAAVTALAAQRIEQHGLPAELQLLKTRFPGDWVTNELVRAWGSTDQATLVSTLRATAASAAPTLAQLRAIAMPTLVLGLHDDPMHPWSVALQWAATIPGAELVGMARSLPQADLAVFGRLCATTAWARAESGEQT